MGKRLYDIKRIVNNAQILSIPEAYECFIYECDDPDGFHEIEAELVDFAKLLPDGIGILDLPHVFSDNKRTRVFGKATCASANGHMILQKEDQNSILFDDEEKALTMGFRPCGKCMPEAYAEWKEKRQRDDKNKKNKDD